MPLAQRFSYSGVKTWLTVSGVILNECDKFISEIEFMKNLKHERKKKKFKDKCLRPDCFLYHQMVIIKQTNLC